MTRLSRRHALLAGLTLAAATACAPKLVLADPAELVPPIHLRIEAMQRRHNTKIGVYAVDLSSGRSITYLDGESFAMCSTFKGYASARVLQMVAHGELTPDQMVFVDPAAIVANSPRTGPRAGGDMTLDELCQAALQVSDNTAGNLLLQIIGGPPAITAFAAASATTGPGWTVGRRSSTRRSPAMRATPAHRTRWARVIACC
jgi:beta-lactamase class A